MNRLAGSAGVDEMGGHVDRAITVPVTGVEARMTDRTVVHRHRLICDGLLVGNRADEQRMRCGRCPDEVRQHCLVRI